jgi:hypothetical protein
LALAVCRGGGGLVERVPVVVSLVVLPRKLVDEQSFGFCGEVLDQLGYSVTTMTGEASELGFGVNADEELDAFFAAVEAEMALAIAALLFGGGQCHGDPWEQFE